MNNLTQIPKIRKLAKEFGTPLKNVEFIGNGVIFTYTVGHDDHTWNYSNADKGIEYELDRLRRLLAIEI